MENTTDQHIYIIGAGAIGKALAVFLQRKKRQVTLIRGSVEDQVPIKSLVSVQHAEFGEVSELVNIASLNSISSLNGIVLIAVKAFANPTLASKLSQKSGEFSVVLLQNGLNVESPFMDFQNLYRCVLFSSSQVQKDESISFKPSAISPIGCVTGNEQHLALIVDTISTDYFGFRSDHNIQKVAWEKAIINCAFNSICPLLEQDNGIFHRDEDAKILAIKVIEECVSVARKLAIDLEPKAIEDKLMLISRTAEGQLISTYVDLIEGRKTEIDNLNLEVARIAEEMGVPSWIPNTKLLGELVKMKSNLHQKGAVLI